MRSLEALALLAGLVAFFVPRGRKSVGLVALACALLHVTLEGARWQMVPAYGAVGGLIAARYLRDSWPRIGVIVGRTLGLVSLGLAGALTWVFPIYELPVPSGPTPVGTRTLFFVDPERDEPFTEAPRDRRSIEAQVWYPAIASDGAERAPYLTNARDGLHASARLIGLPAFFFEHLELFETRALFEAPLAAGGRLPVLVFSHGFGLGHVAQNTWLMQELASRGYVVFSLAHAGDVMSARLAKRASIPLDPDHPLFRATWDEAAQDDEGWRSEALARATSAAERRAATLEYALRKPLMSQTIERWVADTLLALDEIERLEARGDFAGRLDLERVALLGMSLGGATAARVCALDSRCKAGVNLDGFHYGKPLGRPLTRPFLMLYSEGNAGMNSPLLSDSEGPVYELEIVGSTHAHFSELVLQASVMAWFMTPPEGGTMIDAWRALGLVNEVVIEFLGLHLRGEPAPLLEGAHTHPELRVVRISP